MFADDKDTVVATVQKLFDAMAAHSDILFASTTDDLLLRTNRDWINECSDWSEIMPVNGAAGLGCVDGMLFVATGENRLWRLDLHGLRTP